MLSIHGTDFIAHWVYKERISVHAQPAVKCEQFYLYNPCWAYAEQILSHTEQTRNKFHHMLSIHGTDFIACWACADMFKSQISRPNRIWFSKISCYRPLGPYVFGFCQKRKKKISCLCTFKNQVIQWNGCQWRGQPQFWTLTSSRPSPCCPCLRTPSPPSSFGWGLRFCCQALHWPITQRRPTQISPKGCS